MRKQTGFTLIELVLVIVIIGILAAFALPRFTDLSSDARRAALQGLAGGVRAGAALAHAQQLATGAGSAATLTIEGQSITLVNGYPNLANIDDMMVDLTGFTYDGAGTFTKTGTTSNCTVGYAESVAGAFPVVTLTSSGC